MEANINQSGSPACGSTPSICTQSARYRRSFERSEETSAVSPTPLVFRWQTEVSAPRPFRARAFHGETFALVCVPLQYAKPLTGLSGATVALRWQTDAMAADAWYEAPGEYDPATGELSALWGPDCDTGHDRVRFFLALTTPQGASFRAYGTLDLAPSPGFTPAQILPESQLSKLQDALEDETAARQQADNALETALQDHTKRTDNPHGVTAEQVGALTLRRADLRYVGLYDPDAPRAVPIDTHGQWAVVTQDGEEGGLRIGAQAGQGSDHTAGATDFQRRAITVRNNRGQTRVYRLDAAGDEYDETIARIQDVNTKIGVHNRSDAAHADIRQALDAKADAADVYTKREVDGKVAGVYHYKGSVANRSALPASPAVGDVYNVQDEDGQNVAWTGSAWDALGATVDLSAYSTTDQTNAAIQANVQQAYNTLSTATAQAIAAEVVARNQAITQAAAPKANSADVYTKAQVDELIAQAVANAKTQLLAQIEGLYAPLSSVQATAGGVTYRWGWDDTFQTFAMKPVSE